MFPELSCEKNSKIHTDLERKCTSHLKSQFAVSWTQGKPNFLHPSAKSENLPRWRNSQRSKIPNKGNMSSRSELAVTCQLCIGWIQSLIENKMDLVFWCQRRQCPGNKGHSDIQHFSLRRSDFQRGTDIFSVEQPRTKLAPWSERMINYHLDLVWKWSQSSWDRASTMHIHHEWLFLTIIYRSSWVRFFILAEVSFRI